MAARLKTGDKVIVLAGRDKGKKGEIVRILPASCQALVQGVNQVTRHVRPTQNNPQGGKILKEMPIHLSNMALTDPKSNKPVRVGFRFNAQGEKERYAKQTGTGLGLVKIRVEPS